MEEGAKRGGIGVLKQSQQQPLPKLQQQRELAAQLPHTVQDEKDGCLMLGAGPQRLPPGTQNSPVGGDPCTNGNLVIPSPTKL
ncbi:hypothetical protein VULLAG_LOCUS23159 [Vulpes lagopus]